MQPLTIRPLATLDEYHAAVELQFEAWGRGLTDPTSSTILKVGQKVGGVSAGAFDASGRMLGFVFGLTGLRNGELAHWSHMLAVRADAQNLGVGRQLKEYQRAEVQRLGVKTMYWTYDPLVARNAHLNFNILGIRVDEYMRDMYGDMGSDLNRGIGTDRFVAAWPVDDAALATRRDEIVSARTSDTYTRAPVVNPELGGAMARIVTSAPAVRIRVPSNIGEIQATDLRAAAQWRSDTRAAIEHVLASGYSVAGFISNHDAGYYLCSR